LILGIDIGGTKVAYGLAHASGKLRGRGRRATECSGDPEADLARIASGARAVLAEAGVSASELVRVGVAVPGPLDAERRRVIAPPNLPGWETVAVAERLSREFGCPVSLENDANAAALAEHRFGAGQGVGDLVYLSMSTGVGGGLILGGRLHRGRSGNAGELGHTPVEWPGEVCSCGLTGCLEAYIGGAALARRMREHAPQDSSVVDLAGGREHLSAVHLVAAARGGDAWARGEMDRFNAYLSQVIVHLAFALAPEVIVLGTIAAAAGEALCLAPVRARVAESLWPHQAPGLKILPAALGDELAEYAGVCVGLEAEEVGV
jgi:glucokinase